MTEFWTTLATAATLWECEGCGESVDVADVGRVRDGAALCQDCLDDAEHPDAA